MDGFLASFVPQLLATLVGGALALAGAYFLFRAEKRAAFDANLDASLLLVIDAATSRIILLQAFNERAEALIEVDAEDEIGHPAEAHELGMRLVAARMAAKNPRDQRIVREVAGAFAACSGVSTWSQVTQLARLSELLSDWRTGRIADPETVFARAASLIESDDIDVPPVRWDRKMHQKQQLQRRRERLAESKRTESTP